MTLQTATVQELEHLSYFFCVKVPMPFHIHTFQTEEETVLVFILSLIWTTFIPPAPAHSCLTILLHRQLDTINHKSSELE